jgi:hypothetical protein
MRGAIPADAARYQSWLSAALMPSRRDLQDKDCDDH